MKATRKILFYVHFNKFGGVDEYVIYQLQQMRRVFDTIIFISNSKISAKDKKRFDGLYDNFLQRKNKGYDFAAWRDAMNEFGWDRVREYDELTIMNDTCFGPLYDFKKIYETMQGKQIDFWGMTLNTALDNLVMDTHGNHIFTPIHIQSYYITFNKSVINSDVFKHFWTHVKDFENVTDVIINYEVTLTDMLFREGFSYDAYYNAVKDWNKEVITRSETDVSSLSEGDMEKYNPGYTCTRPLWLLKRQKNYPFIKTKAITMATSQIGDIREFIVKNTEYPVYLWDCYIGSRYIDLIKIKNQQLTDLQKSKTYRTGLFISNIYRKVTLK